jgi:hypothetical protein
MSPSGMWGHGAHVVTDVSEESDAAIFRVEVFRELGTKLAVTSRLLTLLLLTASANVVPS